MNKKYTIGIILLTAVLLIFGIFYSDGVDSIKNAFQNIEPRFFKVMFVIMLVYWLMQSFVTMQLANNFGQKFEIFNAIKTFMIGEFFSAITPLATGGQPMQLIYMNSVGVSTGVGTSILGVQLFFYHIARLIISLSLTIYHADFFYFGGYKFTFFLVLGFILNTSFAILMVLAAFKPKWVKKIVSVVVTFLTKIKILKQKESLLQKIDEEVDSFNLAMKQFKGQHITFYINLILQNMASFLYLYGVTHYIFTSFGVELESVTMTLATVSSVQMASAYLPMPGGSFGAEGMFFLMFSAYLPENTPIFLVLLVWRILTYYLTILVSFLFTLKLRETKNKNTNQLINTDKTQMIR